MANKYATVEDYLADVPEDRIEAFVKLREVVNQNMDNDFEECIIYNMVGYVVPKSIYPDGYHCTPALPLPFANIANQKNFIALYHMGLYADKEIYNWFVEEYPKHCKYKLDMGKSCIRFKKMNDIPYELIAELMQKMNVKQWVSLYESVIKN